MATYIVAGWNFTLSAVDLQPETADPDIEEKKVINRLITPRNITNYAVFEFTGPAAINDLFRLFTLPLRAADSFIVSVTVSVNGRQDHLIVCRDHGSPLSVGFVGSFSHAIYAVHGLEVAFYVIMHRKVPKLSIVYRLAGKKLQKMIPKLKKPPNHARLLYSQKIDPVF